MFATQHMDAMVDSPRKRSRDDEQELSNGASSFSEHRNKRFQSLPLRHSPTASQQWLPSASVTPLNATPAQIPRSHFESLQFSSGSYPQQNQDADMDMMGGAANIRHIEASDATTRMPTPIQPSFSSQVRGGSSNDQRMPRSMEHQADWQTVQNNRRLPSPISECDDSMNSQPMGLQPTVPDHCEHLANDSQPPSPHNMEHPNAMMGVERPHPDPEGDSASPNRKGHMRSKHTIDTWTWQPGMKRSFSIGYRADCEKCRLKVPGHFNHIVIS